MTSTLNPPPTSKPGLLAVYANRRMATLLGLGFASGLPFVLTAGGLQAWLKSENVSIAEIGLFSLIGLPYALKVLWAPLMDRYVPPLLGRRRGWLVVMQMFIIAAIVGMALTGPHASLLVFAAMAGALALFSASQDIVADAYRTDVLPPVERGAGAAVWVMGWRLGFAASGVGAFYCVGHYGIAWSTAYLAMAGLMLLGVVASILAPEPAQEIHRPETLLDAVWQPLKGFIQQPAGWLVLAFVLVFKWPEVLADTMTIPFLQSIGISQEQIGIFRQGFGIIVLIAGTAVGGGMVARLGLKNSLWICGVLHGVSNAAFLLLVWLGARTDVLITVVGIENFIVGLTTAAFIAFLMSQCDARFSATQYALLSGGMALSRSLLGAPSGWLADHLGWQGFFFLSITTAIPGLILLHWIKDPGQEATS